jgi:hypothetical protein
MGAVLANIAEVKAGLSQVMEQASGAAVGLRAAADDAERSLQQLRACLSGTNHPRALQSLIQVQQRKERLIEAADLAEQATVAIRAYVAVLG